MWSCLSWLEYKWYVFGMDAKQSQNSIKCESSTDDRHVSFCTSSDVMVSGLDRHVVGFQRVQKSLPVLFMYYCLGYNVRHLYLQNCHVWQNAAIHSHHMVVSIIVNEDMLKRKTQNPIASYFVQLRIPAFVFCTVNFFKKSIFVSTLQH